MRKRITPSLVISCLALFVALAGTGYTAVILAPKNSVGTAAIKDGSIRLTDIAPSTVSLLHGQTGAQGPQGPQGSQGLTGQTGPAGLNGGFNPAKVQVITSGDTTISAGGVGSAQADCPGGTIVIAGGGFTNGEGVFLDRPAGNSWIYGATSYASISATVRAYAICAAP